MNSRLVAVLVSSLIIFDAVIAGAQQDDQLEKVVDLVRQRHAGFLRLKLELETKTVMSDACQQALQQPAAGRFGQAPAIETGTLTEEWIIDFPNQRWIVTRSRETDGQSQVVEKMIFNRGRCYVLRRTDDGSDDKRLRLVALTSGPLSTISMTDRGLNAAFGIPFPHRKWPLVQFDDFGSPQENYQGASLAAADQHADVSNIVLENINHLASLEVSIDNATGAIREIEQQAGGAKQMQIVLHFDEDHREFPASWELNTYVQGEKWISYETTVKSVDLDARIDEQAFEKYPGPATLSIAKQTSIHLSELHNADDLAQALQSGLADGWTIQLDRPTLAKLKRSQPLISLEFDQEDVEVSDLLRDFTNMTGLSFYVQGQTIVVTSQGEVLRHHLQPHSIDLTGLSISAELAESVIRKSVGDEAWSNFGGNYELLPVDDQTLTLIATDEVRFRAEAIVAALRQLQGNTD